MSVYLLQSSYTPNANYLAQLHLTVALAIPNAKLECTISLYSQTLSALSVLLPPLGDTSGLDPLESISRISPRMISHHTNYHACVMLLHSLKAKDGDMRARSKMIESARALAELCPLIQGKRGLKPIHASLLLAVRVFLCR